MKQRLFRSVALLLIPLLLLAGCRDMGAESGNTGSLLPQDETDAEPEDIQRRLPEIFALPYLSGETVDPIACPDGMQEVIGSLLYEGLFQLDENLTAKRALCSTYSYQPDTFTYRLTIREDARFSDGSPCTVSDAAATLNRARTSSRYRARLSHVTSVQTEGSVLLITLNNADTGFLSLLDIPIVKAGTESAAFPLGTGPYAPLRDADGTLYLQENPHRQGRAVPLPTAQILLSPVNDRESMLYHFSSLDVHLITADLTGTEPVSVTGNVTSLDADTTTLQFLGFNTQRPLFQDPQVRQAVSLGINRAGLVNAFLSGHGLPAQFPISPLSPLYPEELETTYSYEEFAAAMKEAGLSRHRTVRATLIVNAENSFKVAAAEHLANVFSDFDLKIEVRSLPWEEYLAALTAGNFDLYYGEIALTADWDLRPLLSSAGPLNYGRWSDPVGDALLATCVSSSNRVTAMSSLCTYFQSQCPIVPLCFKSTSVLMRSDVVEGLQPTMANPFYQLSDIRFHLLEKDK